MALGATVRWAAAVLVLAAAYRPAAAELRKPLTDAQIRAMEEQWEEEDDMEDDEYKIKMKAQQSGGGFDPSMLKNMKPGQDVQQMIGAAQAKGQTKMMFVRPNADPETGKVDKKTMNMLAARWQGMLGNAHVEVKPYMIEQDQFLYTVDDGANVPKILEFLQAQPEFDYLEVDQKTYHGKHSISKAKPEIEADRKRLQDLKSKKSKARAEYDRDHGLKHKLPPKKKKKGKKGKKGKAKKKAKKEEL